MAYREFIEFPQFTSTWAALGMNDDDLRDLQNRLIHNPESGPVIQHTGGTRKIRVAFAGQGKRSSGRVIYVDISIANKIYMLTAYPKNQQENLSQSQKQSIGKVIELLKGE